MSRFGQSQLLRGSIEPLLLACLEDGPGHGYRLIEVMRERSSGVIELAEGTIYPALHRLERGGLVRSEWSAEAGNRHRRTYRLTERGAKALAEHRGEWRAFAGAVSGVLLEGNAWTTTA